MNMIDEIRKAIMYAENTASRRQLFKRPINMIMTLHPEDFDLLMDELNEIACTATKEEPAGDIDISTYNINGNIVAFMKDLKAPKGEYSMYIEEFKNKFNIKN